MSEKLSVFLKRTRGKLLSTSLPHSCPKPRTWPHKLSSTSMVRLSSVPDKARIPTKPNDAKPTSMEAPGIGSSKEWPAEIDATV
jgi:hypothetical protein